MKHRPISIQILPILALALTQLAAPAAAAWPPKGLTVAMPVTRDNWVSSYGDERYCNTGGASRMKLKGRVEFSMFDIDAASLKGKIISGALWHFRCASVRDPIRRVTVSTLASPWVEGTASSYARQKGSSCFAQAELGKRDWSYPGSTLLDVAYGGGRTIWRFAEAAGPDNRGWQTAAIDPDIIAARIAGLSYGLAAYDDVGSEWSYLGGKFTYHTFPNRYIFSHEQSASKPWVEVCVAGTDNTPPGRVTNIAATTDDLPAGEAIVSWTTPADTGGSKTLGFNVSYTVGGKTAPVPRWLIPFAGPVGKTVRMHLADLPIPAGSAVTLAISAVDAAGNVGPAATKTIRVIRLAARDEPARRRHSAVCAVDGASRRRAAEGRRRGHAGQDQPRDRRDDPAAAGRAISAAITCSRPRRSSSVSRPPATRPCASRSISPARPSGRGRR